MASNGANEGAANEEMRPIKKDGQHRETYGVSNITSYEPISDQANGSVILTVGKKNTSRIGIQTA